MAYMPRTASMLPPGASAASSFRQPSQQSTMSQQQSSVLASRIAAKRAELDNLRQLRDMSAALALQMQALQDKLGTLKDGTEAVACVLANWDNVLRAISMASTKAANLNLPTELTSDSTTQKPSNDSPMPATLVRIPVPRQAEPPSQ
ncbi:DASH complex subunit dad2 [Aspergillus brasiliensis]|nr:DASH complex subunit dad2 [Aspergillus brasiliensis]